MARESLKTRYNCKIVLIQVQIISLFELKPAIKKELSTLFCKLVYATTGHLKALESSGKIPNMWGSLLSNFNFNHVYKVERKKPQKSVDGRFIVSLQFRDSF